jgi:hypothetical protein
MVGGFGFENFKNVHEREQRSPCVAINYVWGKMTESGAFYLNTHKGNKHRTASDYFIY